MLVRMDTCPECGKSVNGFALNTFGTAPPDTTEARICEDSHVSSVDPETGELKFLYNLDESAPPAE